MKTPTNKFVTLSRLSVMALALIIGLFIFELPGFGASEPKAATSKKEAAASKPTASCKPEKDVTTLVKKDLKVGKGAVTHSMGMVKVHYTGCLTNGTKFDSSLDRGEPFSFVLGRGDVIKGWDQGLVGMKVGGKRRLFIPPDLGYGAAGAGGIIPPNSTLVFDVELLDAPADAPAKK